MHDRGQRQRPTIGNNLLDPLRTFLRAETSGGAVLLIAAVAAVLLANSPLSQVYEQVRSAELTLGVGALTITESVQHWINDAAMVLFFFVVGLEIKRELVVGELRDPRTAALPALAAAGGVVLPALIFFVIVLGSGADGAERHGWGIPMATDIAFAVGMMALLSRWMPGGARLFLLSIAIVDDIIAIGVIAVFYSDQLQVGWLGVAVGCGLLVLAMRRLGVSAIWPYLPVGAAMWLATFESGVHATIAGVALGLLTPARPVRGRHVLRELENRLHPISAFAVIPVFALANAGVNLGGDALAAAAASPLAWGVAVGLLVGKIFGITAVTLLARRTGIGSLPAGVAPRHVWSMAALAGIGFTVSLFVSELAFTDPELIELAKIGVFGGSLSAGLFGAALTVLVARRSRAGPRRERG